MTVAGKLPSIHGSRISEDPKTGPYQKPPKRSHRDRLQRSKLKTLKAKSKENINPGKKSQAELDVSNKSGGLIRKQADARASSWPG